MDVTGKGKTADGMSEWRERTHLVMEALPDDCVACHARIEELSAAFRWEIAEAMQRRLNAHLKTLPHETFEERKLIASFVNMELRELGLTIRCPKTGKPAILIADVKDAEHDKGRFRLQVCDEKGKNKRTVTCYGMIELELMPDAPRKEGMARKWPDRDDF